MKKDYHEKKYLGQGSFGVTFLATRQSDGKDVAVKLLMCLGWTFLALCGPITYCRLRSAGLRCMLRLMLHVWPKGFGCAPSRMGGYKYLTAKDYNSGWNERLGT